MVQKAPGAYQTISEVSLQLDVPAHVLRFWESKFSVLKPLKRSGGRRYYRTEDIQLLKSIKSFFVISAFQRAVSFIKLIFLIILKLYLDGKSIQYTGHY